MANKYWVGGGSSANWDATAPTNWSDTDGGANNATAPATGDSVFFTSTAPNCTLNTSVTISSIDFNGYTGIFTHNAATNLTIGGTTVTARWSSGMTYTLGNAATSAIIFSGTSGTVSFTTSGQTFGNITRSGIGGTTSLQDALSMGSTATLSVTGGTFTTNNNTVTVGIFSFTGASSRTLTLGSSTINITGSAATIVNATNATSLTITSNTATLKLTYSGSVGTRTTVNAYGNTTFPTVWVSDGNDNISITGSGAYGTLDFTGWGLTSGNITWAASVTTYGSLIMNTGAGTNSGAGSPSQLYFYGTSKTITSNGKTLSCAVTFSGASASYTLLDAFAITSYLSLNGGTFVTGGFNVTALAFYGSSGTARVFTPSNSTISLTGSGLTILDFSIATNLTINSNTATFKLTGGTSGTRTITQSGTTISNFPSIWVSNGVDTVTTGSVVLYCNNFDSTGFTGTWAGTGNYYLAGNLAVGSGVSSITHSGTINFTATAGTKTITTNGKTLPQTLVFNGSGGTFQLADSITLSNATPLTLTAGTFDANSQTVSLTAATSTLSQTFTFYNLTKTGGNLALAANQVVTNLFTVNGSSATARSIVYSSTYKTARTITGNSATGSWCDFRDITAVGTTWDLSAVTGGSGDFGGNTNITFTTPATIYWYGPTGNMTDARWYTGSGGTGVATRVPLAQDSIVFDSASFTSTGQTVTQNITHCGSVDWTGVTNNPTWNVSSGTSFYGSLTLSAGMTLTDTTNGGYSFTNRNSATLTSAGKTWTKNFSFLGPVTIQDTLDLTGYQLALAYDTLSVNGQTIKCRNFFCDYANTRALNMGGGTVEITGTAMNVINFTTVTGLTFPGTRGTFKLTTNSSSGTRTLLSNYIGNDFPNIWLAAGTDTVTPSGTPCFGGLTTTGFSGTYNAGSAFHFGNIVLSSGVNLGTNTIYIGNANTTTDTSTYTVTTNGKTIPTLDVRLKGGIVQLVDTLTCSLLLALNGGTLDTNDQTVNTLRLTYSNGALSQYFDFGTSTINITGNNATVMDIGSNGNGLVIYSNNAAINFTYTGSVGTRTISNCYQGANFPPVTFAAAGDIVVLNNTGTDGNYGSLDFTGLTGTVTQTDGFGVYGNLKVASSITTFTPGGAITFKATSGTQMFTTGGKTMPAITVNGAGGTVQLQDALTSSGLLTLTAGTFDVNNLTVTALGFSSNNTNARSLILGSQDITLTGSNTTVFNVNDATNFSTSHGGTSKFKLTYSGGTGTRTVYCGATSSTFPGIAVTAGTDIITSSINTVSVSSFDFTGFNGTWSGSAGWTFYGSLTLSAGMTRTFTGTLEFRGDGTITSNGKTFASAMTVNASGKTVNLGDAFSTTSVIYLVAGTFSTASQSVTCSAFSSNNSNARTFNIGASEFILTALGGTIIDFTTATNLSFTPGTSGRFNTNGLGGVAQTKTVANGYTGDNFPNIIVSAGVGILSISGGDIGGLDFTGSAGTWGNANPIGIYGSLKLVSSMIGTQAGQPLTFKSTSPGKTITSAGKIFTYPVTFDGVGGSWQLIDSLVVNSAQASGITLTNGTLDINGQTVTIPTFSSNNANTRGLTFANGTIEVTKTNTTVVNIADATGLTINDNTGTIKLTGVGTGGQTRTVDTGYTGTNFPKLWVSSGSDTFTVPNALPRFGTVDFTGFSGTCNTLGSSGRYIYGGLTLTAGMTAGFTNQPTEFMGTATTYLITCAGKSFTSDIYFNASTNYQLQDALNLTGELGFNNGVTFNTNNQSVTCRVFTAASNGDHTFSFGSSTLTITGNNASVLVLNAATNLTINANTAVINCTYSGASGTRSISNSYTGLNCPTLNITNGTDVVTFGANSTTGNFGTVNLTGFNGTLNNSNPQYIYGNFTLSGSTVTGFTGSLSFKATSGTKTITSNGKTWACNLIFDGVGGTWQYIDALASSGTMTLTNGTIDANDQNVTTTNFSSNNSNTRSIVMGTGIWTVNGTGTVWDCDTVTGLTITPETSTIVVNNATATVKTFAGGSKTYNDITFSGDNIVVTGDNTFGSMAINNGGLSNGLKLTSGSTQTITALTTNGSAGNLSKLLSTSSGSAATLSKATGSVLVNYISIQDSAATGGATFTAGGNSINVSGNTGWIFLPSWNPLALLIAGD